MAGSNNGQRHDRQALIAYASETGNSQDAAEHLGRIFERQRFTTKVAELDDIEVNELLKYTIVVFAISTTGQGDIPSNGRKFWKSVLRKRLPPDLLSNVNFTTIGLGDSSYVKFNWAARKLHKRVVQLGAREVYPRGEADEQHDDGIDGVFLPWSVDFTSFLRESYPLPDGLLPIPETELLPPRWTVDIDKRDHHNSEKENYQVSTSSTTSFTMDGPIIGDIRLHEPVARGEFETFDKALPPPDLLPIRSSFTVQVIHNGRLTASNHWQDVRHIAFNSSDRVLYSPGDVLTIYPKNFPSDVDALIDLMDWGSVAELPLTFINDSSISSDSYIPALSKFCTTSPPTLRSLLINNLDITAIPRRYFFEMIAKFCDNPTHRERLLEFTNPAYTDEFFDYTTRPRRSILEVLQDFPSVRLPWRWVTSIFPALRGRQFSICSGGILKYPDEDATNFEIVVALVKYRTVLRKVRQGVCSRYLSSLPLGTRINITLATGSFSSHNNSTSSKPLLMIAPGTGIAPMRSLIYERAYLFPDTAEHPQTPATLIFGGRNRAADFLFEKDWRNKQLGVEVLTAFSRDQREKIYVQDVVRQNAALVWKILKPENREGEGGGTVFVCGSSGKMPVAVRAALVDVFVQCGGLDVKEAQELLEGMEKKGRFLQETW